MTLSDCKASDKLLLTAEDVAEILNAAPQAIRLQAQREPEKLGFPVAVIGTRIKIPRKPFLSFLGEATQ